MVMDIRIMGAFRLGLALAILGLAGWAAASPRVVVMGFDGVDYHYVQQYLEAGELPNLQRLREHGDFKPLMPTVPPQTPVSWSTFTTGMHPGRHMIFDFLKRDPQTYMPTFAVAEETKEQVLFGKGNRLALPLIAGAGFGLVLLLVLLVFRRRRWWWVAAAAGLAVAGAAWYPAAHWVPDNRPGVESNQKGTPLWEVLAPLGVKSHVMRIPVTFPVRPYPGGHMLAGLGVPDLSGRIGKPFFFTSDLFLPSEKNEFSVEIVELPDNRGRMEVEIVGPPNKLFKDPPYIKVPMALEVAEDFGSVRVEVCGQTLGLKPGEWSDWVDFVFPFNPLVRVRGVGRFHLLSIEPEVRLYLSPINFDPRHLPVGFDVTYPHSWAKKLADTFGVFRTMGWAVDTWSVSEELTDDAFFAEEWRAEPAGFGPMFNQCMKEDSDLVIIYYEFTDRVGHIFFRYLDEQHPRYDAEAARQYGSEFKKAYQMMDAMVGEAMAQLPPDATLIVLSDHGFATWRWGVNYNTWLVQNGYMALTGAEGKVQDLYALFDQGQFWPNVDWSRTRAYCMGLGGLYVNLKGREAKGIVEPGEEYENLRRELIQRMEGWTDEATGLHPVAKVYTREEAYGAFDPVLNPDMIVTNTPGYRVSWQTSLGGIPSALIETNDQVWSGDHCSFYPPAIPGILFANRMINGDSPYIADLYPSILGLFGAAPPYTPDGRDLFR